MEQQNKNETLIISNGLLSLSQCLSSLVIQCTGMTDENAQKELAQFLYYILTGFHIAQEMPDFSKMKKNISEFFSGMWKKIQTPFNWIKGKLGGKKPPVTT